jgi:polar amino acid transport system substrate-binding protein
LAFLSGAGGGFIRDIIIKNIHTTQQEIQAINGNIYGEVAIFWGGFLSTYLFWATANVNPTNIKTMVLLTIGACFLTRLLIYYYNIPNLYFYSGKKINDW